LFGISEVIQDLESEIRSSPIETKIRNLLPTLKDWADSAWSIIRGTVIGFFLGVIPGGGPIVATFAAYAVEKKSSKHPERFGHGAIQGVAAPEAAHNAAAGGAFIPLLTLGIPPNPVMAILLGALMIHGLQPGPLLLRDAPEVFWGVIMSMYIGNIMLMILNLPLIGLWVKVLKVPYFLLYPLIIIFCLIGAFHPEQQGERYTDHAHFRRPGLSVQEVRLRCSAPGPGPRAGAHAGGIFSPIPDHILWQLHDFCNQTDCPVLPGSGRRVPLDPIG